VTGYLIQPAREEDVPGLAGAMRLGDAAEVRATAGWTPAAALLASLRATRKAGGESWTLRIKGEVAALWGVHPLTSLRWTGIVWLLTGQVVERHRRLFAELSRAEVVRLLGTWPRLCNWIDARYGRALRWAEWTGAQLGAPVLFGVEARAFRKAVWVGHGG